MEGNRRLCYRYIVVVRMTRLLEPFMHSSLAPVYDEEQRGGSEFSSNSDRGEGEDCEISVAATGKKCGEWESSGSDEEQLSSRRSRRVLQGAQDWPSFANGHQRYNPFHRRCLQQANTGRNLNEDLECGKRKRLYLGHKSTYQDCAVSPEAETRTLVGGRVHDSVSCKEAAEVDSPSEDGVSSFVSRKSTERLIVRQVELPFFLDRSLAGSKRGITCSIT